MMQSRAAAWLAAARSQPVALELESVYAYTAAQIESRGPACWASGRCCNFDAAGHRLYTTGLEAAYTIARLESDAPDAAAIDAARASGGCPFQAANLCSVHLIKPLGCRVYFCDRTAQSWQQELTERALERIRAIHTRSKIEYCYAEWRDLLAMFSEPHSPR